MPITDLATPVLRPLGGRPEVNRAAGQSPGPPGLSRFRSTLRRVLSTDGSSLPQRRMGGVVGASRVVGSAGVRVF